MKILVTGGAGFIGKYLVEQLSAAGHNIVVATSNRILASSKGNIEYRFLNIDWFDNDVNYYQKMNQPDVLIHLAWQGLPNYTSLFHIEDNLPAHYRFIKNLVTHGLSHVCITGTCFEYGMREGELSEDLPADPQNAYAVAKDSLRRFISELSKHQHFVFQWIRLFYMYGKGQNPNSLLSQLDNALDAGEQSFNMSGGEQLRDYLPVEVVAEYIINIALQKEVDGVINCCSGKPVTVKAFVQDYLQKKGKSIELNTGYYPYSNLEPMAFWGNTKKLKTILDNE